MATGSAWTTAVLLGLSAALAAGLPLAVALGGRRAGVTPERARRIAWIVAGAVAAWLLVTALVAGRGLLLDFRAFPPPLFRVILPGIALTAILAFSPAGHLLAGGHSWGLLIGFQAYRVPVEFMLAGLHAEGLLPVQMTYHGLNFDILTGLSALGVAWLAGRGTVGRGVILAWNIAGLALLVNIVTVAILSLPSPFRVFTNDPVVTLVFHFPYIWLPTVIVLAALLGHLLVFRKLWQERAAGAAAAGKGALA